MQAKNMNKYDGKTRFKYVVTSRNEVKVKKLKRRYTHYESDPERYLKYEKEVIMTSKT